MATARTTYIIMAGVRRAKAFAEAGYATIKARLTYADGHLGPIIEVEVDQLLSPKGEIDMRTAAAARRYWRVLSAVQMGFLASLPLIEIQAGQVGTPIRQVKFQR